MKIYFKNLDGIRFLAAFLVVIHHAFFFKMNYSPGFQFVNHMFEDAGRMGVNLFFVLSGFLISYLLLVENDKTGTISFKNFYVRRMLRIWPLYLVYGSILTFLTPFLLQYLGQATNIPIDATITNFLFLIFFAVNIQLAFFEPNPGIFEISWSVCIEEQFYLIWPLIVYYFRRKLIWVFFIMVIFRFILRACCLIIPEFYPISFDQLININYLLIFDKLDLFGGGLFLALFYYNKDKYFSFFRVLWHPVVQVIMLLITLLYVLAIIRPSGNLFFYGDDIINVFLFGYLLIAAVNENSVFRFENKLMRTLGKISYGIYLFHTAVCQLVLFLFIKFIGSPDSRLLYDIAFPVVATIATCIISYFSYEYFEKYFLKKKNSFAAIKTRI